MKYLISSRSISKLLLEVLYQIKQIVCTACHEEKSEEDKEKTESVKEKLHAVKMDYMYLWIDEYCQNINFIVNFQNLIGLI